MSNPLDGVVVVSLEQAVSAPFATRQLADLGATVIKIERNDGGDMARHYDKTVAGQSSYFVWANGGKHSVVVDVKTPEGKASLDELIGGCDVFVQNLSPAAAFRLGVSADQLRLKFPSLIACDISGYGTGGPRTNDKAYDLAIQAEAGVVASTGTADQPCKVGFSAADISTSMYVLSGILAALYRRSITGEGASIEVSMLECLAQWTAPGTYLAVNSAQVPERSRHRHAMIAPYGFYELSDGNTIMFAVQNSQEWSDFAVKVLRSPTLVNDERFATNTLRVANILELEDVIAQVMANVDPSEFVQRLEDGRITTAQVRDPFALWDHPQLKARDRFTQVETETGFAKVYKSAINIDAMSPVHSKVPALGEHDPDVVAAVRSRGANRIGTT